MSLALLVLYLFVSFLIKNRPQDLCLGRAVTGNFRCARKTQACSQISWEPPVFSPFDFVFKHDGSYKLLPSQIGFYLFEFSLLAQIIPNKCEASLKIWYKAGVFSLAYPHRGWFWTFIDMQNVRNKSQIYLFRFQAYIHVYTYLYTYVHTFFILRAELIREQKPSPFYSLSWLHLPQKYL